ncbi:MAG: prephenate dehydratase [Gammaproteobacteria bacterium]
MSDTLTVAYLGPAGTYSQAAVLEHFGAQCQQLAVPSIDEAFVAVQNHSADAAVVPIENSTEGIVNNTQDCLVDAAASIIGEVILPIEHHLLLGEQTSESEITTIVSHPQSLAQCRRWLKINMPNVVTREAVSNADAAQQALNTQGVAAIAGSLAAQTYGLQIARKAIQDQAHNKTRFIVLGEGDTQPTGRDKTSILVYAANKPGALFHVLEPFENLQISLTKIDSRPAKKAAWEYVFFIDFEGHRDDEPVQELFRRLDGCTEEIKLLGSYPACDNKA